MSRVKAIVEQSQAEGEDEEMKEDFWAWFELHISLSGSGQVCLKEPLTECIHREFIMMAYQQV